MSDIFRTRKTPKHLIIEEYPPTRPKGRISFLRVLGWCILAVLITWSFIQARVLMGI